VQYEKDGMGGKRERGGREKTAVQKKHIRGTRRVMVEMGVTWIAEEGWWE